MIYLLYTVHVLICLFLILVVLLQQGKGADLSVFGGGGTMTAFGARGAATLLHKMTVASFVAFILTTVGIGVMQGTAQNATLLHDVPTAPADVPAADSAVEGALPEAGSEAPPAAEAPDAAPPAAAPDAPVAEGGGAAEEP